MSTLAILGAGGHGKVVADAAQACGRWREIAFFDQAWPGRSRNGPWAVVGDEAQLLDRVREFDGVAVAIGSNDVRLICIRRLLAAGATLATVIHPKAVVSSHASVGAGSVVFAAAVVNPGASIGMACIVNTAATVDHDCVLADGVHVSPGAHLGGGVQVGAASWIGIGASIKQYLQLGANTVVGAGAAVVHSFPGDVTLVGVPAQILDRKNHAE